MVEARTTRKNPELRPEEPLPAPVSVVVPLGERHRCSLCHEQGNATAPAYLCHHCGRAYCAACAPRLSPLLRPVFAHQELKWYRGRGQQVRLGEWLRGEDIFEAAHCPFCVHQSPRAGRVLGLLFLLTVMGMLVLYLLQFSLPWVLFVPLLAAILAGIALGARAESSRARQQLFYPLEASHPRLELRERFEADGVLDGDGYVEHPHTDGPRGLLQVIVDLQPRMSAQLDAFQRAHNLRDWEMEDLPATAGSVIVENVGRIREPDPPWPESNARRWELAQPLPHWPLLWLGEGPTTQTLEFRYQVFWRIPRLPFSFAFPVQVQAYFPQYGARRTLELLFPLTGGMHRLSPFFQKATLQRGEGLPRFALHPSQGRSLAGSSGEEVSVSDLRFGEDDHTARLLLHFEEEPPQQGEAWLTGEVVVGFVDVFSDIKIPALYDAFGHSVPEPRLNKLSRATLHFRINVAALPYQRTSTTTCALTLRGISARRDDALLRALDRATRVVSVHEQLLDQLVLSDGTRLTVPTRDIMGHWPGDIGEALSPVVFHVHLLPAKSDTSLDIQVQAVDGDGAHGQARAEAICQQLKQLFQEADAAFWGAPPPDSGERPAPPRAEVPGPTDEAGSRLLRRLRNRGNRG